MTEHERDPLDELREADRWMTKRFYDRIADAWQAEREKHERELSAQEHASDAEIDRLKSIRLLLCDELKQERATNHHDELVDVEAERDELQDKLEGSMRCSDELRGEVAALQAKLDASIPLPLDADGVPCAWGDLVVAYDRSEDHARRVRGWYLDTQNIWWVKVFGDIREGSWVASECHHVAPKPETIEDVLKDAFIHEQSKEYIERAYECGKRDGGDGEWTGRPLF